MYTKCDLLTLYNASDMAKRVLWVKWAHTQVLWSFEGNDHHSFIPYWLKILQAENNKEIPMGVFWPLCMYLFDKVNRCFFVYHSTDLYAVQIDAFNNIYIY